MVITLLNFFIDVASAITSHELWAFRVIFEREISSTTVLLLEISRENIARWEKA